MRPFVARAWRSAMLSGAVGLLLAFAADRWYAGEMRAVERERVRARMAPYAHALGDVIDRRIGILRGFHSFVSTRRTRADLDEQFPVFARGAVASATGVRALQFYQDDRIAAIEPLEANRAVLGFDLSRDPRPRVYADHQRALATRGPLVSGPIRLIEGGTGILLRQRLADRDGFPQLVAVLLDAPSLVADAGIPDSSSGLRLQVSSFDQSWKGGDQLASDANPVTQRIDLGGMAWVLSAAPASGWQGGAGPARWSFRGVLAAFVLLLVLVALELGDRLDRLTRARAASDSVLAVAMRAGRLGVWSLDLATGRLDVSGASASFLGPELVEREDAMSFVLDLMPPEDRTRLRALFEEVRRGERESVATEFRLVRPDGAMLTLLSVGQVVRDAADRPVQLVGLLSNITERRAMEARLQQSERFESVGRLAGGVAHDFSNLLTAMGGFAELAVERVRAIPGRAAEAIAGELELVLDRTRAGAQLTSQLLAFSRRAPAEASRVDLGVTLGELQPVLTRLFAGPMKLQLDVEPRLPAVRVVSGLLTQVILSLLTRSRDARPAPERVRLHATHVPATSGPRPLEAPIGEWVCVEIAEEGTIAPAAAAVAPPATRRSTPGVGLPTVESEAGWGIELAVLASGIETSGGRLVSDVAPTGSVVTRIFLPLWDAAG